MLIDQNTPLIWTVIGNSIECFQLLLDYGAFFEVKGDMGKTVKDFAVLYRRQNIIDLISSYENIEVKGAIDE